VKARLHENTSFLVMFMCDANERMNDVCMCFLSRISICLIELKYERKENVKRLRFLLHFYLNALCAISERDMTV
jgi:hypothetical protein